MARRHPPIRGAVRALRGGMLATSSTALAVTAHGVSGGGWSEVLPALPMTLLVGLAGTALADRGRGSWTILGALGVAELAQHSLLSVMGGEHYITVPQVMLCAHVIAVLLTAALLARADAAVVAVASAVARLVPLALSLCPPPFAAPRPAVPTHSGHVLDVLLRRVCTRRGPPVLS
ncbi:hypothetical protein BC739_006410 [Kutzneria viridogrisea]|uniref:MFS transporter n=2 Tax=Kutzneria TaxID=43356 RepID=A0ABR6BQN1_9PSEU|nr:hypothetical protein [Kutzneria albida]MBA8929192.1 hypothetical protein [Kutzneria viridogrisea]